MADDVANELGLDTSQAVASVLNLTSAFDKYVDSLNNVTGISTQFNEEGKVGRIVIRQLDQEFNKLNTTFALTEDGFALIGQSATEAVNKVKQSAKVLQQVREGALQNRLTDTNHSNAVLAREQLKNTLSGPNVGIASTGELNQFNVAIERIVSQVAKGKISLAELDNLFTRMTSGAKDFTYEEQKVVDLYEKAIQAANNFGTVATNASNRAARASQAQYQDQQRVLDRLFKARQKMLEQEAKERSQKNYNQAGAAAQAAGSHAFGSQLASATPDQVIKFANAMQRATALVRSGKVSLNEFIQILNNVRAGKISTELNPALTQLQARLRQASRAFENLGATGEKSGTKILLTFGNIARIFQAQVLFSAFSHIQSEIAQSAGAAAEYSKQIALIETISQDSGVATEEWSSRLRDLSDQLGSPLPGVAAAAYDALSNQITHSTDTFEALDAAMQFGRTTNASTADSINLISSAINSFDLEASDAERVARTFFTTIDLGRVTASELANSFGRTGTLASSLGVSLEETQAAISTLTRQGIKANEAYTLINNLFIKLIKPTEELQDFFNKLGYASGQDATAALTFAGVLKKLDDALQGNTAKTAKLFDELRGLRAALNLGGKGLRDFLSDLEQISNSGDKYDIAKKIVGDSEGQKFQIELNKLKNLFVQDVGPAILSAILRITDFFGGAVNAVKSLIEVIKLATIAMATFFLVQKAGAWIALLWQGRAAIMAIVQSFTLATASATAFGVATRIAMSATGIGAIIALLGTLAIAYYDAAKAAEESFEDISTKYKEGAAEIVRTEKEFQAQRHQALQASLDKSKSAFLQYFASIRIGLRETADKLKEDYNKIVEDLNASFGQLKGLITKSVTELEGRARKAADNIRDARDSVSSTIRDAERDLFNRNLDRAKNNDAAHRDLSGSAQLDVVNRRIDHLRNLARIDLFNQDNLSAGLRDLEEARQLLDRLSTEKVQIPVYGRNGQQTGSVERYKYNQSAIEQRITNLLKEQISLTEKYIQLQDVKKKQLEAQAQAQEKALKQLEESYKKFQEFNLFDKKGNIKKEYEGDAGRTKALQDLKTLQQEVVSGLEKTGASIPDRVAALSTFTQEFLKFKEALSNQTTNVKDQLSIQKQLEDLDKEQEKVVKAFTDAKTEAAALTDKINEATDASAKLAANARSLVEALKQFADQKIDLEGISIFQRGKVREELKTMLEELDSAIIRGSEGKANKLIDSIEARLRELDAQRAKVLPNGVPLEQKLNNQEVTKINGNPQLLLGTLERVRNLSNEISQKQLDLSSWYEAFARVNAQAKALEEAASRLPGQIEQAAPAAKATADAEVSAAEAAIAANNQVVESLGTIVQAYGRVRAAAEAAAAAQAQVQAGGGGQVEHKANGGLIGHFAAGGFLSDFFSGKYAKGTDVYPTMLGKDEFVVNANSTRKFLPILRALNAGVMPSFQSAGNSHVTTVGDVHVTVSGSGSSEQTAANIGRALRRGIRQGTIRLN